MLYLYAITGHPAPPLPDRRGLEDAPLREVVTGALAGVVSEHAGPVPSPDAETLWRHQAVAEALMADRTVLPVRFGTGLDDEEAVRASLEGRATALTATLERVRGHVEMGVRARLASDQAAPEERGEEGTGTAYLQDRLARRRAAEAAADAVHTPLAALATAATRRVREDPPILRGAYLIPGDRVEAFTRAVDDLATETPLVCTGPWPPYSFAEDADG